MGTLLNQETSTHQAWYRGLDKYCWIVLTVAAMGWLFDTMDQNIFNLVRIPSLNDLLRPHVLPADLSATVQLKSGLVTAIFLLGWSVGGFIFGILGDRLGRARTMIITIFVYAIFTGLSGLVHSWEMYAFMRFMTALGVGGEWAAGAALVAETFPARSRPMALGLLQALSAVGNMIACIITLVIPNLESNWRWAYFVGAAPALVVFWIAKSVREPEAWQQAKAQASLGRELGSIRALFADPVLRRNTIAATLLGTAGVGTLWGIAYFSTDMVRAELVAAQTDKARIGQLISMQFLVQQAGAFFGAYCFAFFADKVSRRLAFLLWFTFTWVVVLGFFWGIEGSGSGAFTRSLILSPILGFCTLGPFAGYTIYFPELFPTRLRATGCGFCYNAARILSASAPFALGGLLKSLGGSYAKAASLVSCVLILGFIGTMIGPETKGKGLPDDNSVGS